MTTFGMTFAAPDFVITGGPGTDGVGVRVVASKKLTHNELSTTFDHMLIEDEYEWPVEVRPRGHDIVLTTHMQDAIILEGPDYQTVMAELFKSWTEEGWSAKRAAIEPPQRAIGQ